MVFSYCGTWIRSESWHITMQQLDVMVLVKLTHGPFSHAAGRFAFIELRTLALADAAVSLDKLELMGRQMNIGRPKGYEPPPGHQQQVKLNMAQMFAAQLSGQPTNVVLLENLIPAGMVRQEQERREVR